MYRTSGVCAKIIEFVVEDEIVKGIKFQSGCDGNLQAISKLAEGMKVEDVIRRLKGIKCGNKLSSCPDQLARALAEYSGK
ncbi:MAG: TIGR03905 family TSCPD domain-containing protein [Sporomusa sp.]